LSPDVVIAAGVLVKQPGAFMRGEAVELVMRHQPQRNILPYERLIGDAVRGETPLFTNDETVETAWEVVDAALSDDAPVLDYVPGCWGPAAAAGIVAGDVRWHDPKPEEAWPC
jgi:glucose-6-phosphate 1-dehydrogenase